MESSDGAMALLCSPTGPQYGRPEPRHQGRASGTRIATTLRIEL